MNGQDLLEFLTQRNTIGRIRYHRAKSDPIFQRRTLSRNVRHCQTRTSSNRLTLSHFTTPCLSLGNAISLRLMKVC